MRRTIGGEVATAAPNNAPDAEAAPPCAQVADGRDLREDLGEVIGRLLVRRSVVVDEAFKVTEAP